MTLLASPLRLHVRILEVQRATSPLGPQAKSGKALLAKESLSPASEDLFSLEDMLEHSACLHSTGTSFFFFFSNTSLGQLDSLAGDFLQYLKSWGRIFGSRR